MSQTEQIPWSLRVEGPAAAQGRSGAVTRLLQAPVPSVMLGAALTSGQPCLLWNAENLLNEIIKDDQTRFQTSSWTLLEALLKLIRSANPDVELNGYVLLFHFLVEPFALMNRSTVFYPPGKTPQSAGRRPSIQKGGNAI